jgi:hypothetical protein
VNVVVVDDRRGMTDAVDRIATPAYTNGLPSLT